MSGRFGLRGSKPITSDERALAGALLENEAFRGENEDLRLKNEALERDIEQLGVERAELLSIAEDAAKQTEEVTSHAFKLQKELASTLLYADFLRDCVTAQSFLIKKLREAEGTPSGWSRGVE